MTTLLPAAALLAIAAIQTVRLRGAHGRLRAIGELASSALAETSEALAG